VTNVHNDLRNAWSCQGNIPLTTGVKTHEEKLMLYTV